MLQWGRVGEDAEVRRSQCRDLVHVSCFNGAASVRTRKCLLWRRWLSICRGFNGAASVRTRKYGFGQAKGGGNELQWGRVGEDAEVYVA